MILLIYKLFVALKTSQNQNIPTFRYNDIMAFLLSMVCV